MSRIMLVPFLLLGLVTVFSYQNCSRQSFSDIDPLAKATALDNHPGFVDESEEEEETPPTTNTPEETNGTTLDIKRYCRGLDRGATLLSATSMTVEIYDDQGKEILCTASGADLLKSAIELGEIKLPNCDISKAIGTVKGVRSRHSRIDRSFRRIRLGRTEKGNNQFLLIKILNENGDSLIFEHSREELRYSDNRLTGELGLLLERDVDRARRHVSRNIAAVKNAPEKKSSPYLKNGEEILCDAYKSSPLVVDMRPESELSKPFRLTAPKNGVFFDIDGMNGNPAYTQKLISGIKDPRIMNIVLPDENGEIKNIDQLFGNNTLGPDGEFAANGFLALEKYDGLSLSKDNEHGYRDRLLTIEDDVFSKLKLWSDKNHNGEAEDGELYSLEEMGVISIGLEYDPNYISRDRYGNEIRYKSVLKLKTGKLKPIFDIWYIVDQSIQ